MKPLEQQNNVPPKEPEPDPDPESESESEDPVKTNPDLTKPDTTNDGYNKRRTSKEAI